MVRWTLLVFMSLFCGAVSELQLENAGLHEKVHLNFSIFLF